MHPAKSIVFFTTLTGAGYGLLACLGLFGVLGLLPAGGLWGAITMAICFALIFAGLLSSTGHLSHRERAWRAFTQWRSSWLSREAVAALLTLVPAGLFALGWVLLGAVEGWTRWAGAVASVCALLTIFTTGMIYASLKPVMEWHTPFTVPGYLIYGLMSGLSVLTAILSGLGHLPSQLPLVAALFSILGFLWKRASWYYAAHRAQLPSVNSATGLEGGTIRSVQWPHSSQNFLLKEMGFRIARKHSQRLRLIAQCLAFAGPAVLLVLAELLGGGGEFVLLVLAATLQLLGLLVERWLFFAEATHTISLYYGLGASSS
jgi:DMSO reductase anchor subunit